MVAQVLILLKNKMENQKNLFLAIIISMAIIFGFQLLVPQPERSSLPEEQASDQNLVDLSIQGTSSSKVIDRSEVISKSGKIGRASCRERV